MTTKKLLTLCILAIVAMTAAGQEYYDLTEHYLTNSLFDGEYDYDQTRTGNVAVAPSDYTSRITNPSFEQGTDGWEVVGMKSQSNNVFNIKVGSVYMERWTGKGSAVGSGRLAQELQSLPPGNYKLTVAAQNIQEDMPTAAQTGAWIFAGDNKTTVTVRNHYTVAFNHISGSITIGFEAQNATGNWLAVDNFRLTLVGDDLSAELAAAIEQTAAAYGNASGEKSQQLKEAIETARTVAANPSATGAEQAAAIIGMEQAVGIYLRANASANNPLVMTYRITNPDFETGDLTGWNCTGMGMMNNNVFNIKHGTWYVERWTWKGNAAGDARLSQTLTNIPAGRYRLKVAAQNIQEDTPQKAQTGAWIFAGDKKATVAAPKGTIWHWYNNGGDEASNDRINSAINTAIDYYWNNLTSIHGFGISVQFGSGTETADCSYGGSMRVGPKESYQQVGTIMHEAFHGIGVGTHGIWWNGDMRSNGDRGDWLGDRVTEAVRFWNNSTTDVITGDNTHLWPYGCNGAHEDTHTDNLYCMMGILAQALNEDGLPGSAEIGYALPYYAYNHEDGVKYYLKNEDENRGLYSAYLVETADHQLQWKAMSADEAMANDAAAWYLTFTPSNQYYQLRNAATDYYITYASNTFKTVGHTTPTSADNLHLMRGRLDVGGHRGYYIIHPESSANPPALNAADNGKTATSPWSILRTAKSQRWLVMTADDIQDFETNGSLVEEAKQPATEALAWLKALTKVPHEEEARGADDTVQGVIGELETALAGSMTVSQTVAMTETVRTAGLTFLRDVIPTDEKQPFDLTWLLANPTVDENLDGWTATTITGQSYGCVEYYQKAFDFSQTVTGLPFGKYDFQAQAFQRPGPYASAGNVDVNALLYAGATTQKLAHITVGAQSSKLGTGREVTIDGKYVPDNMEAANAYFDKNLYPNSVIGTVAATGGSLPLGVKSASMPSGYWVIFDNFHLYYHGYMTPGDINRDGQVDATDVACAISHLLGLNPEVFSLKAADQNADGVVDILDVTALIEKIRTKQ